MRNLTTYKNFVRNNVIPGESWSMIKQNLVDIEVVFSTRRPHPLSTFLQIVNRSMVQKNDERHGVKRVYDLC
uniref:Uncharacterized protein n=1 Tax=Arion vulgaris TaxID=1028688 RepID=A0A0B7BFC8_9EUPU